jgi:uridine phosphorylase
MPSLLRPTASVAADAVLVGDPGRALLLAQELLAEPKMSNHARGLWGYGGRTPAGRELTIQSTGVGGPSAALVLADLAELGVRRAVRVGICLGIEAGCELGELLVVGGAVAAGGSSATLGASAGETVLPDATLTGRLRDSLGERGREATVASVDVHPPEASLPPGVTGADMQTAPLFARAGSLAIEAAALLIVAELNGGELVLERDALETAERSAGQVAAASLSG